MPAHRLPLIDALKALASQVIVLHHLCFYGPMSDVAMTLGPAIFHWFAEYGRLAVQVFLVISGFLAARSIAPEGHLSSTRHPGRMMLQRYVRLIAPLPAVILCAVVAATIARQWMTHDSIPGPASPVEIGANIFLLHDLLGVDSLSAGIWYVAIDFQLYVLLLGALWLGHARSTQRGERRRQPGAVLTVLCALAAVLFFNRQADLDHLGLYFFGSYALGAFAWWAAFPRHPRLQRLAVVLVVVTITALLIDFRSRLALALLTALLLRYWGRTGRMVRWGRSPTLAWLSEISYSVFLLHFSVLLVLNAVFTHIAPHNPMVQLLGMLLAWGLSVAAGHLFHRHVELPVNRLAGRILSAAT